MNTFNQLFAPGRLGRLDVANRIVMPPMATLLAQRDSGVGDALVEHYARRARGGAGAVIVEITAVHRSAAVPYTLSAHEDRFIDGLARLARAIQAEGSLALCQLGHFGPQSSSRATGHPLVAPSDVPRRPAYEVPQPASPELIEEIIESFVQAAARLQTAGFDGVEFHGAHGYLISAFMSPASNLRDDAWGGDTERRCRLATEIIRRTRARLGDFPIVFRISVEDGLPGGIARAEGVAIARLLADAGADAISVSAGCYDAYDRSLPSMAVPQACNAALAQAVRQAVSVPVIVAGRINEPEVAEDVLASGAADFIAVGRGLLCDPDFPLKARSGRAGEIRRCIACNACMDTVSRGKPIRCTRNPALGDETADVLQAAARAKRVLVAGGGPAGMQAALTLSRRGHDVTLFEREASLGGKIPLCAAVEWKRGFESLGDELAAQVRASNVKVELGQSLTAERAAAEAAEAIVLACGAEPFMPDDIAGLAGERAVLADDLLMGKVQAGPRVFIIGGGYTACELALMLARRGHQVTMARRSPRFGTELGVSTLWTVLPELEQLGVRLLAGVRYEGRVDGGVALLVNGEREVVAADTVVAATGYRPVAALRSALEGLAAEVHAIGDFAEPRTLVEAIHEGHRVGALI